MILVAIFTKVEKEKSIINSVFGVSEIAFICLPFSPCLFFTHLLKIRFQQMQQQQQQWESLLQPWELPVSSSLSIERKAHLGWRKRQQQHQQLFLHLSSISHVALDFVSVCAMCVSNATATCILLTLTCSPYLPALEALAAAEKSVFHCDEKRETEYEIGYNEI